MKTPDITLITVSAASRHQRGVFSYSRRWLIDACSSPTTCRVFYSWLDQELQPSGGRALLAVVQFHGGETPAERIELHEAVERQKGQRALEAKQLLALFADTDPAVMAMVDARTALRESLEGMGVPAAWMRSDEDIAELEAEQQELASHFKVSEYETP